MRGQRAEADDDNDREAALADDLGEDAVLEVLLLVLLRARATAVAERVEVRDLAEQRARKLTKISRTLGENVPPELVFSAVTNKKNRRASVSSAIDVTLPLRAPQDAGFDSDSTLLNGPRTAALPFTRRQRSNTTSRPRSRAPFAAATADPNPVKEPVPPIPVFTSGPARVAGETWVGSWNRPDIHTVQTELRALRWR